MIGETVSHCRIAAELGAGGMGVVYRAEDLTLGRPAALKFLPGTLARDAQAHERCLREARSAQDLEQIIANAIEVDRARAQAGDTPGAETAYEAFFEAWKNADADIPILVEARAEYARLGPRP